MRRFRQLVICVASLLAGCSPGVERLDYSVGKLQASLQDKDPEMRYWAAKALGEYGPKAHVAIPNLVAALKDDTPMVRMGAAYALAEMGPAADTARSALEGLRGDADKEVRDAAAYAIQRITAKSAGPAKKK